MVKNTFSEFDTISRVIDATIIKNLNPTLKNELKKKFETFFPSLMMGEMELRMVIDANIILDAAISITEGKRNKLPFLQSPHLKAYAPSKIKEEVFKHIPERAKKRKIDELALAENALRIMASIQIVEPNLDDLIKAQVLMQNKDVDDAPYVGLIFTTKSAGVITNNVKDFSEIKGVKVVKINETSNILTNFEQGTFSFFIFSNTVPTAMTLFFEFLSFIFTAVVEFFKRTTAFLVLALTKGVETISKGGIALAAVLFFVLISWGKEIASGLKWLWSKTVVFFKFICEMFRELFNFLMSIGAIFLEFALFMISKINIALELSQKINLESTGA